MLGAGGEDPTDFHPEANKASSEDLAALGEQVTRITSISDEEDSDAGRPDTVLAKLAEEEIEAALQNQDGANAEETSKEKSKKWPVIPGYEILGKLGQGGMGTVYKARQISMDRLVALKVLPQVMAKDANYIERFLREAKAAGRLNHPNIVQGIDVGDHNGMYFFIMEYVDGPTLRTLLMKNGVLDERSALDLILQVTLALEQAAEAGIVHRDIKPDNIFITSKGVAKLGDLGLAKTLDQDQSVTMAGTVVGTPFFMSPEQARGEDVLDSRSDIYSLGVTLFNILTGDVPFRGNSVAVTLAKHLREEAPDVCSINPKVSHSTRNVLNKMMAKSLDVRYQNPTELAADLRLALGGSKVDATVLRRTAAPGGDVEYKFSKVLSDDELVFCMIALKSRLISAAQLKDCLDMQERVAEQGARESLGSLMVERGILTEQQVKSILRTQEQHQRELERKTLGQIILAKGYATKEQIQFALDEQARLLEQGKASVLGDLLVSMGFITAQQKNEVLQIQENARQSKEDISFGKTVHSLGLVSTKPMNEIVRKQKALRDKGERKSISDLLVEAGLLSPRERDVVLRAMKRMMVTGQELEDLLVEQRVDDRSNEASRLAADDTVLFSEDDFVIKRHNVLECPFCLARLRRAVNRCPKCGKSIK